LAGACTLALLNSRAGAQQSAQSQLSQIEQKQSATASDIDALNRQADQLLGQASALKQKATELHTALIQKQAELEQAQTKLAAGEAQLSAVSEQLQRALVVLRDRLVQIYKSDQPDAAKRVAKLALMDGLRADYVTLKREQWGGYSGYDGWFARANNASLGVLSAYFDLAPNFERLFEREGRDFARFYAEVKRIAALPQEQRRARLP